MHRDVRNDEQQIPPIFASNHTTVRKIFQHGYLANGSSSFFFAIVDMHLAIFRNAKKKEKYFIDAKKCLFVLTDRVISSTLNITNQP